MYAFRHHRFSLADYFELELESERKFEFYDGVVLAMAGAKLRHNEVQSNVAAALHARYRGRCRVLGSDQRLATGDGLHTYPDASVVCGKPMVSTYKGTETVHNPSIVVEVLSPSTREYDLGEKREHYETTPSLRHLLLIEPESVDVRHVRRTERGWETLHLLRIDDALDLDGVDVPLSAIYVTMEE